MASDLRISVHFLQPYSHGRGDDGLPEWPPSPLRLFQALVASGIGRQVDGDARARTLGALRWLESQAPPEIVAPASHETFAYRLYVPDNIGDKVAKAWSAGRDADLAEYRTEKEVRSMRIEGGAVHYVFRSVEGVDAHLAALRAAARSMTHLGWGIDMVAGDATLDTGALAGERWIPGKRGGTGLRCAIAGTLNALEHKHTQFLQRLDGGTFRPVSPLTLFAAHPYARATDPALRPFAAFRLREPGTGDQLSLDPARRARDIAAWTRHAVAQVSENWPFGSARTIVHGHTGAADLRQSARRRFSFLPLPTINPRRTDGIARVLVVATLGLDAEIAWIRAHLAGHDLVWKDETIALLDPLPDADWVLGNYVGKSDRWSTVTPVVLPGHDDHCPRKAERLLRKAFLQAGFEPEVLDGIRELEWRKTAFRPGVEHAARYLRPDKVSGPLFHVRVRFGRERSGPIAIGSGRHRGLGVFALAHR